MNPDPIDELNRIESTVDLASHTTLLRRFMLLSSRDLAHLPTDATNWLRVAQDYATGSANAAALEAARVAAWESIAGRDCDTTQPMVSAVRAVICLLYPDFGRDPFDYVSQFIDFSNHHDDHGKKQTTLLRELFAEHIRG